MPIARSRWAPNSRFFAGRVLVSWNLDEALGAKCGRRSGRPVKREPPYWEYQARNPFRPPDWRFRRARNLVENGRYYSTKRDDTQTGIALRYLRARRQYEDCLFRLRSLFPGLHAAYGIRQTGGLPECELQSRILARQATPEIASATLLDSSTVDSYKSVFFDISARLESTAYVTHVVIVLPPTGPPPPSALMKLHAYRMGPAAVDAWVDT